MFKIIEIHNGKAKVSCNLIPKGKTEQLQFCDVFWVFFSRVHSVTHMHNH